MNGIHPVSRRRTFQVLAGALLVAAACGKKKDAARSSAVPVPKAFSAPLTDATAEGAARAPAAAEPAEAAPAWVRESPHFFMRDGARFASAVGSSRSRNAGLARAAAEDRARVDLIRLIDGVAPDGAVEGALSGAQPTDFFTSKKDGQVFVRLEVRTAPG